MRIAIDAWEMVDGAGAGTTTYLHNLILSLAKIDHHNQYTIYTTRSGFKHFGAENFEVKELPFGYPRSKLWHHAQLSQRLLFDRPDIFISHSSLSGWYSPCRLIFIVLSVAFLFFPQFYWKHKIGYNLYHNSYKISASHTLKTAKGVITLSLSAKRDLAQFFNVDEGKTSVIYAGYDTTIFSSNRNPKKIEAIKEKYKINGNYILFVGVLQPGKNIPRLIEAFALLKRERGLTHKLVIVGGKGRGHESVFQTVKRLEVEKEVVFTNNVSRDVLPYLYQGADLFIFPSLYEAFGLPLLECMACGTPVITSNISSLPEVVEDAAILVNPYNVEEIAEAINQVISNDELKKKLSEKGLNRAKAFSWEKTAQEVLRIIEQL